MHIAVIAHTYTHHHTEANDKLQQIYVKTNMAYLQQLPSKTSNNNFYSMHQGTGSLDNVTFN